MITVIGKLPAWPSDGSFAFADIIQSTGCDLAYYCNQCPSRNELEVKNANGVRIQKACSDGQGRSVPCDKVEEAIAERHKVFHFGG